MGEAGRPVREVPSDAGRAEGGDSPVRTGDLVAHYEIVAEVGRGGMGIVFRARDKKLERDVALKCPWPRVRDPVIRERFLREAKSAARLSNNPHVLPVFQALPWRGIPWIAMELVDGTSLRKMLAPEKPLDIEFILATAEGLADALRAAHVAGIIHRDINPNNILVRDAGRWALLTDFGLVADRSAHTVSEPLTAPGYVVGTQGYMSPEQMRGGRLDPRSDIYSLGAVLYEMCTGRRACPGGGDRMNGTLLSIDPLAGCDPEVTRDLERIIRKALAEDPGVRHRDASELVTELKAVRARLASASNPATATRPRRFPTRLAAGALGLVVLVAVAAVRLPSRPPLPDSGFPAGSPLQVTRDPGCEAEPAISPDGQSIAYTAIAGETSDIWITDPRGASRLRLTDEPGKDHNPAWFPDGSEIAFVSDRGGEEAIWTAPRLGGSAVLLVPNASDPAVSPDGRRIAFARRNEAGYLRIAVADLGATDLSRTLTADDDGVRDHRHPAWSPDGRTICYSDARNLWVVPADGGPPRRLTDANALDFEPVWSRDGRYVVFSSFREGTQALWRVPAEGGVAERLTIGTGPESHASLSSDGSRVVYSTLLNDYDIVIVDLATGARALIESRMYESAPTFAPGGTAVAFTSIRPGGRMDLWLQPLSGERPSGPMRQLTDLIGGVNTPAFSPDGRWVAFKAESEGRVGIWVTGASGGLPQRFSDASMTARHPAWSPDGAALAYILETGVRSHVWVAPIRDGRPAGPPRQVTQGDTTDEAPVWSPDGRAIAYVTREERHDEIKVAPLNGANTRLVVRRTGVGRVRWEKPTGWLWFSAISPQGTAQLWKVRPDGRQPVAATGDELFAEAATAGDFELSADGRLLAYTRQQTRGDIWLVARNSDK